MYTRDQIEADYETDAKGRITSPGKFEGEMIYIPFFWSEVLNGGADDEDGNRAVFIITPQDRALFPEIPGDVIRLELSEDNYGFIHSAKIYG